MTRTIYHPQPFWICVAAWAVIVLGLLWADGAVQ